MTHSTNAAPPRRRRRVFGIDVDVVNQGEVVRQIMEWCRTGEGGILVTPNLDHLTKLRTSEDLRRAYEKARLVLPDGRPLVWMARLDGGPPLSLVTGSDLIDPVCAAAARDGRSVFLLGSRMPVLEKAATVLKARYPALRVAGFHSPPMGFERSEAERRTALDAVRAAAPDILFVALGAPKQEIWAAESFEASGAKAIICIGAGLDFIAAEVARAPAAFRKAGLEWLWRALSEPTRLGPRYLGIMARLPGFVLGHVIDLWRTRTAPQNGGAERRRGTTRGHRG